MRLKQRGTVREPLFSIREGMMLGLLLLVFMDFYLYSMHLMLIAFAVFYLLQVKIDLPKSVIPAVLLLLALLFFCSASLTSPSAWAKRLVWPAAFLLGYGLIRTKRLDAENVSVAEKKMNVWLTVAAIGFFIHLALNLYNNFGVSAENRNTLDIWTGQVRAATGQAAIACVPMAWGIAFMVTGASAVKKTLVMLGVAMMMYYNLTLGNRTMVFSFVIVTVTAVLYLLNYRGKIKKKSQVIIGILLVALLALALYDSNAFGIRTTIQESVLFERLTDTGGTGVGDDPRWRAKWNYIQMMPQYFFGGGHIRASVHSYAHDVLLDTYDEAGILGFVAVVALLWDGVAKLRRLLRSSRVDYNTKVTLLCINMSIFITFALEPILAGLPWLLMTYCFIHGLMTRSVHNLVRLGRIEARNAAGA